MVGSKGGEARSCDDDNARAVVRRLLPLLHILFLLQQRPRSSLSPGRRPCLPSRPPPPAAPGEGVGAREGSIFGEGRRRRRSDPRGVDVRRRPLYSSSSGVCTCPNPRVTDVGGWGVNDSTTINSTC
jgi:hypothetical protein